MGIFKPMKRVTKQKSPRPKSKNNLRSGTTVIYKGNKLRSKLEYFAYQQLEEANLKFEYEKTKFTLIEKFSYEGETIRSMTYLPDFIIVAPSGKLFILEIKGYTRSDKWQIKGKLIKYYFYLNNLEYTFLVASTQKEIKEMIEKIKKS